MVEYFIFMFNKLLSKLILLIFHVVVQGEDTTNDETEDDAINNYPNEVTERQRPATVGLELFLLCIKYYESIHFYFDLNISFYNTNSLMS